MARTLEVMRKVQPYVDAVWMLIGGVGLGVGAGYALDKRLGTGPWLLVAGSVLGMTAGFIGFFTSILKLSKRP